MKRKIFDELGRIEGFFCSRCGEPVWEYDDVCQTCGQNVSQVQESRTFIYDEPDNKTETPFFVDEILLRNEKFIFTKLQEMLGVGSGYEYLVKDTNIYVFKTNAHNLSVGKQINIDKRQLSSFNVGVYITVCYLKNECNENDIIKLKTYNYC